MRGAAGFPFKRYLPWATGTGLFAVLTWYAAEQAATQAPWWAEVPWVMVAIFFLGGFVGTLYADCINTNSSLRNWRQILRAVGHFEEIYNKSHYHNLGEDHGGHQQFISIYVPFTFNKRTEIDAIRLTSQVYRFDGRIAGDPWASYTWKVFERTNHHRGDVIDIPIAHVPADSGYPGVYGDMDLAGYYLGAGSAHLITIELFTGNRPQLHKILIILPSPGGRLLVFQEGRALFPQQYS